MDDVYTVRSSTNRNCRVKLPLVRRGCAKLQCSGMLIIIYFIYWLRHVRCKISESRVLTEMVAYEDSAQLPALWPSYSHV